MTKNFGILFICFLLLTLTPFSKANAVFTCPPCQSCWLATVGGPIDPSTKEKMASAYNNVSEGLNKAQEIQRKAMAQMNRFSIGNITNTLMSYTGEFLGTLGKWNPFSEEEKEPARTEREKQAQSKANYKTQASVEQRMQDNIQHSYNDELKGDYKSEIRAGERRRFVEQQAAMKLLARTLVIKSYFKDLEEFISKTDKDISQTISHSEGGAEDSTSSEIDEVKLRNEEARLWLIYYRLMQVQTQIDAAYLEYEADKSLATMKPVKALPKIKPSSTEGASSAK